MDQLIQVLYGVPIVGLLLQLGGYIVAVLPNVAPGILQAATPIALAALCGVMCERAGVVNIGIEGIMITAAFVGWYAGVLAVSALGTPQLGIFGLTPALIVALAAALISGV
jgi:simple sugar transport system permease protein